MAVPPVGTVNHSTPAQADAADRYVELIAREQRDGAPDALARLRRGSDRFLLTPWLLYGLDPRAVAMVVAGIPSGAMQRGVLLLTEAQNTVESRLAKALVRFAGSEGRNVPITHLEVGGLTALSEKTLSVIQNLGGLYKALSVIESIDPGPLGLPPSEGGQPYMATRLEPDGSLTRVLVEAVFDSDAAVFTRRNTVGRLYQMLQDSGKLGHNSVFVSSITRGISKIPAHGIHATAEAALIGMARKRVDQHVSAYGQDLVVEWPMTPDVERGVPDGVLFAIGAAEQRTSKGDSLTLPQLGLYAILAALDSKYKDVGIKRFGTDNFLISLDRMEKDFLTQIARSVREFNNILDILHPNKASLGQDVAKRRVDQTFFWRGGWRQRRLVGVELLSRLDSTHPGARGPDTPYVWEEDPVYEAFLNKIGTSIREVQRQDQNTQGRFVMDKLKEVLKRLDFATLYADLYRQLSLIERIKEQLTQHEVDCSGKLDGLYRGVIVLYLKALAEGKKPLGTWDNQRVPSLQLIVKLVGDQLQEGVDRERRDALGEAMQVIHRKIATEDDKRAARRKTRMRK